ncbi:MAG: YlbF family regulator [Clostridiales bacterium]|nr:YlbF family regulator [Clostridiales bacterium]
MEIMELAAELGKKIKEDDRIKALNAAQEAYENDKALQAEIQEYNTQSEALSTEYKKETPDKEFIKIIETRIHELYTSIMGNENMIKFTKAQDDVNAFMNEVNNEITYQITGERPCTHDCSTCHGCH